jgi:hypothetical protein
MHTIISHTSILNSASAAAHPALVHLIQPSARWALERVSAGAAGDTSA